MISGRDLEKYQRLQNKVKKLELENKHLKFAIEELRQILSAHLLTCKGVFGDSQNQIAAPVSKGAK